MWDEAERKSQMIQNAHILDVMSCKIEEPYSEVPVKYLYQTPFCIRGIFAFVFVRESGLAYTQSGIISHD